jgi:hypothetical protein
MVDSPKRKNSWLMNLLSTNDPARRPKSENGKGLDRNREILEASITLMIHS